MDDDGGTRAIRDAERPGRDEELETSRLLVEFLHATYATRRVDEHGDAGQSVAAPAHGEPPGLSAHVIRAAIHVYQHGDRTVSQLAAGLGISLGWASRVADELVERGHAVRERDPRDRRVVRLRMTDASLAEIERAYRWRGDIVARALAEHRPDERAAIRRFLRRVTDEMTAEANRREASLGAPPPRDLDRSAGDAAQSDETATGRAVAGPVNARSEAARASAARAAGGRGRVPRARPGA